MALHQAPLGSMALHHPTLVLTEVNFTRFAFHIFKTVIFCDRKRVIALKYYFFLKCETVMSALRLNFFQTGLRLKRRAIDSSADLCANKRPISLWCFEQVADWLVASHGY